MVRFLVDEVFFKHVNLVVFKHASFSHLTQSLHLSCKSLVFVNLFHEPCILLGLSGVNGLRPSSLLMEHSLFSSADSHGVDLVNREIGDVVQFNKVRISSHVVFILEVVFGSGVEGSANGTGVCESWRPSELSASTGVLVKLRHEIYITYVTQINLNYMKKNNFNYNIS